MGYYTKYSLEVIPKIPNKDKLYLTVSIAKFCEIEETITVNTRMEDIFEEEMKWYDHDKDMIKLSEEYPKLLFKLTGSGEEKDDQWIKYYQNGKCQFCPIIITFDEFDPKKLIKLKYD